MTLEKLPKIKRLQLKRSIDNRLNQLIEALPHKESLINELFIKTTPLIINTLHNNEQCIITKKFHETYNLIVLIDKLSNITVLTQVEINILYKVLHYELSIKESRSKKFWTDDYQVLSNRLWSPTVCKITNKTKQEVNISKSMQIDNVDISDYINRWTDPESNIPTIKTLSFKLKLTSLQKQIIDNDLNTSTYVYNNAIDLLNNPNFKKRTKENLRDVLVTHETRKNTTNFIYLLVDKFKRKLEKVYRNFKVKTLADWIKKYIIMPKKWLIPIRYIHKVIKNETPQTINENIKDFELNTNKNIRAGACFEALTNYQTNMNKLKSGQIKYFKLKHRSKKKNQLTMRITKSMLKIVNHKLYFTNKQMDKNNQLIKLSKRSLNKLFKYIKNKNDLKDSNISKKFNNYYLNLSVNNTIYPKRNSKRVIGLDPGIRTFLTGYSTNHIIEFIHNKQKINKIDKLHDILKKRVKRKRKQVLKKRVKRKRKKKKQRLRKCILNKLDLRKERLINELHWKSINYLIKNYDLIFLEKFESQGFVKNGKNKTLNRDTNNLKPYKFRERLMYKSLINGVSLSLVAPHHTTKTCSGCGNHQDIKLSKIYNCTSCNNIYDRDINSAKNILMKGLLN